MKAQLLLAVLLLAPLALADHVYSHRFVVEGRLIGSDGYPLPGREVQFSSDDESLGEPCREGISPVTDAFGDFTFCYHVHDLRPSSKVTVSYGNTSGSQFVDITFRKVTFFLQEKNETGVAPPAWNETYRLSGRTWMPGLVELEGVRVYGVAVIGMPVNLTVQGSDGAPAIFETHTDDFGDFDLVLQLQEGDANASASVEAQGRIVPVQLDSLFHRTNSPLFISPAGPRDSSATQDAGPTNFGPPPGTASPRVHPAMVLALGLGVVGAILLARKKKP